MVNNIKTRRAKFLEKINNNSIVILFSGKHNPNTNDDFFVNRNFFYLSNISQENSYLVFLKKNNKFEEYIFIDKQDKKLEKWFGKKLSSIDVNAISGIKKNNILTNDIFEKKINFLLQENKIENIYLDLHNNENVINEIKTKYSNYKIFDCYAIISELRMIKDDCEINNVIKAINITNLGFKRIIRELKLKKNNKKEFEIFNAFNNEILNHGTHEIAFKSIIASGINACYLHYPTPYATILKNDLLLCDVGSAFNHYASDITRTIPVNGKFSQQQKKIYEIVLACNKKIIELIKPGITIEYLQKKAKSFLSQQCLEKKIIKKKFEINKYYYHNVSHYLGLDVHDVCVKTKLKPGMVITVEPGLYIKEKKIGIRIEDDILITKNGHKCLSSMIAKEIKDIEKLYL